MIWCLIVGKVVDGDCEEMGKPQRHTINSGYLILRKVFQWLTLKRFYFIPPHFWNAKRYIEIIQNHFRCYPRFNNDGNSIHFVRTQTNVPHFGVNISNRCDATVKDLRLVRAFVCLPPSQPSIQSSSPPAARVNKHEWIDANPIDRSKDTK